LPTLKSEGIKSQSIELAKKIGSKSHQLYNWFIFKHPFNNIILRLVIKTTG
jgi:hypothetical protein